MTDIITRLENATEGQERELLLAALHTCFPRGVPISIAKKFQLKLEAEAWTSAAEMLLPDGQDEYDLTTMYGIARVSLHTNPDGTFYGNNPCGAQCVWAALAAACVRARR